MQDLLPPLRASAIGLAEVCPASRLLSAAGEEVETEIGARGTALHRYVTSLLQSDPETEGPPLPELPAWDQHLGDLAYKFALDLLGDPRPGEWIACEYQLGPMPIEGLPEEDHPRGRPDVIWLLGKIARIIDFKFGPNALEMRITAPQMTTYAMLILWLFPQVEEVAVHCFHVPEGQDFVMAFTRADVATFEGKIREIAAESRANPLRYAPTAFGCQYCAGAVRCRAAHRSMTLVRSWSLEDSDIRQMDGDTLCRLYDDAKVAAKVSERVLEGIRERLKTGAVRGLGLKKREPRSVKDPALLYRTLVQTREILDHGAFLKACRPSVTDLTDVGKRALQAKQGGTLKAAEAQVAELMEPAMERVEEWHFVRDTTPKIADAP